MRGEAEGPASSPSSSHQQVLRRCSTHQQQNTTTTAPSCFSCHLLSSRFHSFLLFLGYSRAMVKGTKAEDFCRTISNFSLEYRSTRQTILLQREREKQKSGAESPRPNLPVGRRTCLQTPSQVNVLDALKQNIFHIKL